MLLGKEANFRGLVKVSGMRPVRVVMGDYYFEPTVLRGEPGRRVTVNLRNKGSDPHTFTLRPQQVDVVVPPGNEARVTVRFPQSGAVLFVCRFHTAQGMRGALTTQVPVPSAKSGDGPGSDGGGGY